MGFPAFMTIIGRAIKRHWMQIIAVLFWLTMIALILHVMRRNDLNFLQFLGVLEDTMQENWYGPVLFIFVFVVARPFTLVPVTVLVMLGGRIYGVGLGFVYCMIGLNLTAILPYYFGLLFTRREVGTLDVVPAPGWRSVSGRIERFLRRNSFESLLAMRLSSLPFDMTSLVAGYIAMPFGAYMGATFLGNIATAYGFAALGASVEGDIYAGQYSLNSELLISSVAVLLLSLLVSLYLRRRNKNTPHAEEDAGH